MEITLKLGTRLPSPLLRLDHCVHGLGFNTPNICACRVLSLPSHLRIATMLFSWLTHFVPVIILFLL